jgi:hypothetical protein
MSNSICPLGYREIVRPVLSIPAIGVDRKDEVCRPHPQVNMENYVNHLTKKICLKSALRMSCFVEAGRNPPDSIKKNTIYIFKQSHALNSFIYSSRFTVARKTVFFISSILFFSLSPVGRQSPYPTPFYPRRFWLG